MLVLRPQRFAWSTSVWDGVFQTSSQRCRQCSGREAPEAGLFSVGEFIPDAPYSQNQLRVVGIFFDLGSKTVYVRVNRAIVSIVRIIPDFFEQILPRKHSTRV